LLGVTDTMNNTQSPIIDAPTHTAAPPSEERPGSGLLDIPRAVFRERFNKRQFIVHHALSANPLFELSRLIELAKATEASRPSDLYYDAGVTDINERWGTSPCSMSVEETIERITSAGAFIILKRAEYDPAYAKLLNGCMSDLLEISGRELERKMRRKEVIIFITSPNRVTTYHIDSECNFLLQIRGKKEISVFQNTDREVLPEEEIERFWTVDKNAAYYKPELQSHADVITLEPGNGVHIPVNSPHWVQNGNNISISVSINYSSWNWDYANVYCFNYYLRKRFGLNPTPPFKYPLLDNLKRPVGGAILRYKDWRYGPVRKP